MIENYEIVEFQNGEFKLNVSVTPNSETVWLSVYQMSKLFNKNKSTILRHIKNILEEENAMLEGENRLAQQREQIRQKTLLYDTIMNRLHTTSCLICRRLRI